MVTTGSVWGTSDGKRFRVISVTDIEGHTWVYYRQDFGYAKSVSECKEYSCYLESFVSRFSQLPE